MLNASFKIQKQTKRVSALFTNNNERKEYLRRMIDVQHAAEESAKRRQRSKEESTAVDVE